MREYPKIESLFDRDEKFKVVVGKWRLPEFEYLQSNQWLFTEKVDGTNVRVHWDGEKVRFGGRTDNAQMPVFLLAKLQELFPAKAFLDSAHPEQEMILFGEGYGAKIQKGGGNYIPDGVDFILFDVLVPDVATGKEWWLRRQDIEDVADAFGLNCVPIIARGTLAEAVELVRPGLQSRCSINANLAAEGLVLRPEVDIMTRSGHRIIAKIKTKDF